MADKETELEKLMFAAKKVGQSLKLPYSAMRGKDAFIDNISDLYDLPRPTKKTNAKKMKKGGEAFPDLTGDGKVTRADILKGRGVKGFKGGGCVMSGRGGSFKGMR